MVNVKGDMKKIDKEKIRREIMKMEEGNEDIEKIGVEIKVEEEKKNKNVVKIVG